MDPDPAFERRRDHTDRGPLAEDLGTRIIACKGDEVGDEVTGRLGNEGIGLDSVEGHSARFALFIRQTSLYSYRDWCTGQTFPQEATFHPILEYRSW